MSDILVIGGIADGKRIEYMGRTPRIDGEPYVLWRFDGVEVYVPPGIGVDAVRAAFRALGLVA